MSEQAEPTPTSEAAQELTGELPAPAAISAPDPGPKFSRAILALISAATLAVAPISTSAVGPAGSGGSAHSSPVYILAQAAHDIGHNDWAFEGGLYGRIAWTISYFALGLFWLAAALWIRARVRRAKLDRADPRQRLWIKVLVTAWATETVTGCLTLGGGLYVDWDSSDLGPALLRAADLCSPWMSCVAVLIVLGLAERRGPFLRTPALWGAALYGIVLALVLVVSVPVPDTLKIIVLAAAAAAAALADSESNLAGPAATDPVTPPAVAAG